MPSIIIPTPTTRQTQLSIEHRSGATAIIIEQVKEMRFESKPHGLGILTIHMRDKSTIILTGPGQDVHSIATHINEQVKRHEIIRRPKVSRLALPHFILTQTRYGEES